MTALFFWAVLGGLVAGCALSTIWFDRDRAWLPAVLIGVCGGITTLSTPEHPALILSRRYEPGPRLPADRLVIRDSDADRR